ncbi:MAG: hypothetical protein SFV17_05875 [Candidatus Obscuribacter sp.]|nr:hypothetical protein [Candidatus Melainabacteria bacterium]MDX1986195.1 hypothetical protein [Candidatus Obscuribacter sp.]
MADVTFVTYDGLPLGDPDDQLALDILRERGLDCTTTDWLSGAQAFRESKITVLRSCWNYHMHLPLFRSFLEEVAACSHLLNPLVMVQGNLKKTYLCELARRGLPVCPTVVVEKREELSPKSLLSRLALLFEEGFAGAGTFIVKPAVGLATWGVKKVHLDAADGGAALKTMLAHMQYLREHSPDGDVLLQPYLSQVEKERERALVFIDGEFSHAVSKSAFQHLAVAGQAGESPLEAEPAEIDLALRVLATLPMPPLYARVDLVPASAPGGALLLELELTEPSLFLSMKEGAAERFARAIQERLRTLKG